MKWTEQEAKGKTVLVFEDFKINECANGRCQLRENGKMRGNFTGEEAAKAHAEFLVSQRKPEKKKKSTTRTGKRARHNKILGHSVCSVARALGQAGIKYPEADAIMRAHGNEMPPASLRVQLGFGRNEKSWVRHGHPAPLTEKQIKELRRLAEAKMEKSA